MVRPLNRQTGSVLAAETVVGKLRLGRRTSWMTAGVEQMLRINFPYAKSSSAAAGFVRESPSHLSRTVATVGSYSVLMGHSAATALKLGFS